MLPTPARRTGLDLLWSLVLTVGFTFEAVANWQLVRLKADPANLGKTEVHPYPTPQPNNVSCAVKSHTDLARGFIKADIVNYWDFLNVFNIQEFRT